jgi:hypothetical protein
MNALTDLQQAFQGYVLRDEPGFVERIAGGNRVDPQRRPRIYFDAYRSRLAEVLATDYEALRALMGDDAFSAACRAYVEATPSVYRNVRWYGAALPEFLRVTPPWADQPILHELALFEWTLTLAFDSADATVVRFEELASLPPQSWPTLGFVVHPSARVLELRSNAPALRKATDAGEPLPDAVLADDPKSWLIWRKALTAYYRSLGEPESWALAAVRDGANFTALCEGLCRWFSPNEAAPQAAALLRQWVDDELISDLTA